MVPDQSTLVSPCKLITGTLILLDATYLYYNRHVNAKAAAYKTFGMAPSKNLEYVPHATKFLGPYLVLDCHPLPVKEFILVPFLL